MAHAPPSLFRRRGLPIIKSERQEIAMADTILVQDAVPDTIETTVNYYKDTGETPYTWSGGTGSTEVRSSNSVEHYRVTMRNGRKRADGFMLSRDGFHSAATTRG